MLKFLLILSIVAYLIYKVGSLFFKAGAASQRFQQRNNGSTTSKKTGGVKGGEYIDYEEVK